MTISNIYHEPNLVAYLQKEYINLVNYYEQVSRQSIFVKYYNINMSSIYEEKSFSTYDHYSSSNIQFDIYEFTPIYFLQAITNRSTYGEDSAGHVLEGNSSIVINTIKRPRINDLVKFYKPVESNEIFRIVGFSTPSNLLHSCPSSEWFELELEYAPIESTDGLNFLHHYVYDLSKEKNVTLEQYKKTIYLLEQFENILNQIVELYYTKYHDLYIVENTYIPISLNELIYTIKKDYSHKFKRIFEKFKSPYGFHYYTDLSIPYYEKNPLLNLNQYDNYLDVFNVLTKEIESVYWSELNSINNELEKSFSLAHQLAQLFVCIREEI